MHTFLALIFIGIFLQPAHTKDCKMIEKECENESEYSSYRDCVRSRIKRSTDCTAIEEELECADDQCETKCNSCNCTLCTSVTACPHTCLSCCPQAIPCGQRRCCVKTCHASCRSSACRTDCKNACIEGISDKEKLSTSTDIKEPKRNITTTINLYNFINSSKGVQNTVHVQDHIDSVETKDLYDHLTDHENGDYINENDDSYDNTEGESDYETNITITGRKDETFSISEGKNATTINISRVAEGKNATTTNISRVVEGKNVTTTNISRVAEGKNTTHQVKLNVSESVDRKNGSHIARDVERRNATARLNISEELEEGCCYVISPKQCVPIQEPPFIRCFHLRRKQCGQFCKSHTVHEQFHEVCTETPEGNKCHEHALYIPQPQPRCVYNPTWPYVTCGLPQQPQFCGGCYNHYGLPYPQAPSSGCMFGCYDDGYGAGPYYRQGPFYRPGYFHAPSCYQTTICAPSAYGAPYPPIFYGGYPPHTYDTDIHIELNPTVEKPSTRVEHENNEERIDEPYFNPYPWQYNTFDPWFSPAPLDEIPSRDVIVEASVGEPQRATITIDSDSLPHVKNQAMTADERVTVNSTEKVDTPSQIKGEKSNSATKVSPTVR